MLTKKQAVFGRRTFDYTVEQWAEITRSIQHFEAKQERIEKACLQLKQAARSFLWEFVNKRRRKQQENLRLKHWTRAGKLADFLMSEFTWLSRNESHPPDPSGKEHKLYTKELDALMTISVMAKKHTTKLSDDIFDGYPKTTAKAAYQSDVLDVWTDLGGKLKISRHPTTGKVKGPLARYFSAVTQPVHGGSLESLPDIMERHVAWKAALDKWRLDMAIANAQP